MGRYAKQKRRLSLCGMKRLIYLLEGDLDGHKSHRGEDESKRIRSAAANTQAQVPSLAIAPNLATLLEPRVTTYRRTRFTTPQGVELPSCTLLRCSRRVRRVFGRGMNARRSYITEYNIPL